MTPELHSLRHLLSAVIIDGIQRSRTDADLKGCAEAAAIALRAGLAAFTTPAEPLVGSCTNASIPVTVNYGGAMDTAKQVGSQGQSCTAAGPQIPIGEYRFGFVLKEGQIAASEKLTPIEQQLVAAAKESAESLVRLAALLKLADAAAKTPINPAGNQNGR